MSSCKTKGTKLMSRSLPATHEVKSLETSVQTLDRDAEGPERVPTMESRQDHHCIS